MKLPLLEVLVLLLLSTPAVAAPGPFSVSADGRQLLGAEGEAVFLNADTPWHILARLDRTATLRYLDRRAEQGFNALLLALVVDDDYHTGSFANAFGEVPFSTTNDFSTPNEAWFAHVDWFVARAGERGFTLLIEPAYIGWECRIEGFCEAMKVNGPDTMREYGRWVGERYREFGNIIWVDGGDADAAAFGALDLVDAVAEGLREASPDQLHTAHCDRYNSAVDCYDREWLDLNATYADCTVSPRELIGDHERDPPRPFLFLEGYYEGEHETPGTCLRSQAYWALLGGAVGHCFGNRPMWDFWPGWEEALASPGANSMMHLARLIASRNWRGLQPDLAHEMLVSGYGSPEDGSWASAAWAADLNTLIVYTPERRPLTVDLALIDDPMARAWWFHPGNGQAVLIGNYATDQAQEFVPPYAGDWVLVIDSERAMLPAPGGSPDADPPGTSELKARYGDGG